MTRRRSPDCPVSLVAFWLALALFSAPLAAHGGQYRGLPLPFSPFTPQKGPDTGQRGSGPFSPKIPIPQIDPTSWQFWWFCNRGEFLGSKPNMRATDTSPIRSVSLAGQSQRRVDAPTQTEMDLANFVLPALYRKLKFSKNRDVQTACLMALAKIGMDHEKYELVPMLRFGLKIGNQQVRETAALALGISHRPEAMPVLIDLIRNTKRARALASRNSISDRTRTFAMYGLGLLAGASGDLAIKEAAFEVLGGQLRKRSQRDKDILVAAVKAMGALRPDLRRSGHKRLLWRILPELQTYYERSLGRSREITQAHVPTAVAMLLGRGHSVDHQRWKALFAKQLSRGRRHDTVLQSVALALGRMVEAPEVHPDDAAYSALLQKRFKKSNDRLVCSFALIALGRIGGAGNRQFLLKVLTKGSKYTERPWAALGLGIHAYAQRQLGAPDSLIGRMLLKQFLELRIVESRAAIAIAIGLAGHVDAIPTMRKNIAQEEVMVAHAEVAFALMGQILGVGGIAQANRPMVSIQTAIARAAVGDKSCLPELDRMMRSHHTQQTHAAIALAYRYLGDRSSLAPLVKTLRTRRTNSMVVAFAAAALGGIADKDPVPWNAVYASGTNYTARVPTLENGIDGILDIL